MMEAKQPVLSTLRVDGTRRWLSPKLTPGQWWARRRVVAYTLVSIYTALPWVRVAGKPAILLDVADRRFYFAGANYRPTETALLMLALLAIFFAVFLITALFGRAWCGWGCPQTVYMEFVFRPIDRWVRRGRGSWRRRVSGVFMYAAVAMVLAHTFLAYFVGVDTLESWMHQSPAQHPEPFALCLGTAALIVFNFGYFREQMCTVACPYARLQSALLDNKSWVIGYDTGRGEPRNKLSARRKTGSGGDCIDCSACVTACPTGIDIRDGLQMECIACAQCVDACDAIMDRTGQPRGLVRYLNTQGTIWRPRIALYVAALSVIVVALGWAQSERNVIETVLLRAAEVPFVQDSQGHVTNHLRLRIHNSGEVDAPIRVQLVGAPEDFKLVAPENPVPVPADHHVETFMFVVAPRSAFINGTRRIVFRFENLVSGETWEQKYVVLGPSSQEKKL